MAKRSVFNGDISGNVAGCVLMQAIYTKVTYEEKVHAESVLPLFLAVHKIMH